MPKYLSGRVRKTPVNKLELDRYNYLDLGQSEPDPGYPGLHIGIADNADGPVIPGDPAMPTGTQYQLVTVYNDATATRYWKPIGGGLIPGSISVYDENSLVGSISSITQLNFVGIGITIDAVALGIAATITVTPPGDVGSVLFKERIWDPKGDSGIGTHRDDFNTSSDLVFNSTVGILTVGQGINIGTVIAGVGGSIFNAVGVGDTAMVGVGTTNPTQNLHVVGNLRLTGTIYDGDNKGGNQGDLIVKASDGTLEWKAPETVQAGAGGFISNIQYHDDTGLVEGASNFVWLETSKRVGIGSTQPTVLLDVLGNSIFTGITTFVGFTTTTDLEAQQLSVSGVSTFVGLSTFKSSIYVVGISTIEKIKISTNKIESITGNLIIDSQGGTTTIDDNFKVGADTESTLITNGAFILEGGAGIAKNLNVGGETSIAGGTEDTFEYKFTTGTNPTTSYVYFDQDNYNTTTDEIRIHKTDEEGKDNSSLLALLKANDTIKVINESVPAKTITYKVTGDPTVGGTGDDTGHVYEIPISYEAGDWDNLSSEDGVDITITWRQVVGVRLATLGGITTTGGDLYVGGDLFVNEDLFLDEGNFQKLIVKSGISTFHGDVHAFSNVGIGTTGRTFGGDTPHTPALLISGKDYNESTLALINNDTDNNGSYIFFGKQRSGDHGGSTILQDDDNIGQLRFLAADGTDLNSSVAAIEVQVDGIVGVNSTPGRIKFLTTSSGSHLPTERLRIQSDGSVGIGTDDASWGLSGAGGLVVGDGSGSQAITLFGTNNADISFGDAKSGTARYSGLIRYNHTDDYMAFRTATEERLRINSAGISTFYGDITLESGGANRISIRHTSGGHAVIKNPSAANLSFGTNDQDNELTIVNGGNVGIGSNLTNPETQLTVKAGVVLTPNIWLGIAAAANDAGNQPSSDLNGTTSGIATFSYTSAFSGATGNITNTGIITATTNAVFTVITNAGGNGIESMVCTTPGSGYAVDEELTINADQLAGSSSGSITVTVKSTTKGGIGAKASVYVPTSSNRTGVIVRNISHFRQLDDNESGFFWVDDAGDYTGTHDTYAYRAAASLGSLNTEPQILENTFWVTGRGKGYFASDVGIGTTNPYDTYDGGFQKRMQIVTGGAQPGSAYTWNGGDFVDAEDVFNITTKSGSGGFSINVQEQEVDMGVTGKPIWTLRAYSNEPIAFGQGTSEIARFDGSGNLGIGTTNPIASNALTGNTSTLVAGTIKANNITGKLSAPGNEHEIIFTDSSSDLASSSNFIWKNSPKRLEINNAVGTALSIMSDATSENAYLNISLQSSNAGSSRTTYSSFNIVNEDGLVVANQLAGIGTDGSSYWKWGTQAAGDRTERYSERLRITGSGNIGIGTEDPTFSSVNTVTAGNVRGLEIFKDGTDTATALKLSADAGESQKQFSQLGYSGADGTAHWAIYGTAGTKVGEILMDSSGKVGINTNKMTDYGMQVIINGTLGLTGDSNTTNPAQPNDVGMNFFRLQSDTVGYIGIGSYALDHGEPDDLGMVAKGNLLFGTYDTGDAVWTERLRITGIGSVGIGTSNPDGILHISSGTSGDCRVYIEADEDNNAEGDNPFIIFKHDGGIENASVWCGNTDGGTNDNSLNLSASTDVGGGIRFFTGDTAGGWETADERARITSDGDVGIGTTNPTASNINTALDSNTSVLAVGIVTANTLYGTIKGSVETDGGLEVTGDLTVKGKTTLGDESSDIITLTGIVTEGTVFQGTGINGGPLVQFKNTSNPTNDNSFLHSISVIGSDNFHAGDSNLILIGRSSDTRNSGYIGYRWYGSGDTRNILTFGHWSENYLMNLDGNGNLGIGITNPSVFDDEADDLVVGSGSSDRGITIYSGSNEGDHGSIFFADGTTGDDLSMGQIRYEQDTEKFTFVTNATTKLSIDKDGHTYPAASTQTLGSNSKRWGTIYATSLNISGGTSQIDNYTVEDLEVTGVGTFKSHVPLYLGDDNDLQIITTSPGIGITESYIMGSYGDLNILTDLTTYNSVGVQTDWAYIYYRPNASGAVSAGDNRVQISPATADDWEDATHIRISNSLGERKAIIRSLSTISDVKIIDDTSGDYVIFDVSGNIIEESADVYLIPVTFNKRDPADPGNKPLVWTSASDCGVAISETNRGRYFNITSRNIAINSKGIDFKGKVLAASVDNNTNNGWDGTNIDHIWHSDTSSTDTYDFANSGGVWNFCSDQSYKAKGTGTIRAGSAIFVNRDDDGFVGIGTTAVNAAITGTTSKLAVAGIITCHKLYGSIEGSIDTTGDVDINGVLTVNKAQTNAYASTTEITPFLTVKNTSQTDESYGGIRLQSKNSSESAKAVFNIACVSSSTDYESTLVFQSRTGETTWAERLRIDSDGRLLLGPSSSRDNGVYLQLEGLESNSSTMQITRNSDDNHGGGIYIVKTRGTAHGDKNVVQKNDELGYINFRGADAIDGKTNAATIQAFVDGSPGNNDMPGRLVFSTTADDKSSPTERLRINKDGDVGIGTTNPTASNAVTNNNKVLAVGILTARQIYGPVTGTLDTTGDVTINGVLTVHAETNSEIRIEGASDGTSNLNFADETGSGGDNDAGRIQYNHQSNFLEFKVNGDKKLRINSRGNGNVGIGTDLSGQGGPYGGLSVVVPEDTVIDDEVIEGASGLQVMNSAAGSGDGSLSNIVLRSVNNRGDDWADAEYRASQHKFSIKGTEKLRITSTGDVGIGTHDPTGSNALTDNTSILAVGTIKANNLISGGGGSSPTDSVFTKSGSISGVDASIDLVSDDTLAKVIEYTIFFSLDSDPADIQAQKVLIMFNGSSAYSQEYAIMYNNNRLVTLTATTFGSYPILRGTTLIGQVDYKLSRRIIT